MATIPATHSGMTPKIPRILLLAAAAEAKMIEETIPAAIAITYTAALSNVACAAWNFAKWFFSIRNRINGMIGPAMIIERYASPETSSAVIEPRDDGPLRPGCAVLAYCCCGGYPGCP